MRVGKEYGERDWERRKKGGGSKERKGGERDSKKGDRREMKKEQAIRMGERET